MDKKEKKIIKKEKKLSLYEKLTLFHKEEIKLVRDVQWYGYKYTDINQILKKIKPLLCKLWLVIIHNIIDDVLITYIINTDNEKEVIESRINLKSSWLTAQELWSKITYYRRYNLLMLLNLSSEDDDWNSSWIKKQINWSAWTFWKDIKQIIDEIENCEDKKKLKEITEKEINHDCWSIKQKNWLLKTVKNKVEKLNNN